ncbi:MAG: ATP-binding cassette domain-containing protein [Cyanobacteria bacterium J06598_3]
MDIIWLLVKASWVRVIVAIAAGLISGGCSARLISIINDALINDALINSSPRASIAPFIAFLLLALCASSVSQFLLIDLAQDSVYTLRMKISQRILAAPLQQLEHLGPSKLLAVLTDDIQAISNTVFIIPNLCINVAVIAGCLVYLRGLSGWLLVAVATFLAVAIALVQKLLAAAYRYLALARQEVDRLFEQFSAVTQGTKELKLNATRRQLFFEEDLQVTAQASRTYIKTAFKIGAMTTNSGQLLFFILIGLLLFGLPSVVPHSQAVLPAYILTITYLLGPIEATIEQLPNLATANVSIQKVNNMGLALAETAEIGTAVQRPFQPDWQTLELKHILHTYPGEDRESQFSIGPVSLTFNAGELVFIVGGNGSGKSTLAKIITGLYRPESGELCLDNTPIRDHNREAYRQLFSKQSSPDSGR